jgi:hypothetical protein
MKWQTTIQHLLRSTLIAFVILGTHAWAQPDFFEDFSDGDPADGSPVTWQPIFTWDGTGYTLTPEGLNVAGAGLLGSDGTAPAYDDVAITAEIRRHPNDTGAEWASGFLFRYNANRTNGYWMEVRGPNRFLLGYSSGAILAQATLPFNVDEQDLMIHMEAQGSEIKGWCWAKGQSRPEQPQISIADTKASAGVIALNAWTVGGQSIFRSVEVYSIKTPIVDFNGDGVLNVEDLVSFIETWGQDSPATDFWHDGTVDKKDLEILMDAWGKDLNDPTLAAHWAMDETEGDIAPDSQGLVHATLVGIPTWQPDAGAVNGAIALDGQQDYLVTDTVLNPGAVPFSLLAWIKGGEPGQVILSQVDGKDLLCTDPINGCLMTALTGSGRSSNALCSDTVITDGNWHRIALVWEGDTRTLYVDDAIAAQDTETIPDDCVGGLNIGCSTDRASGSFFEGMIDELRIYNRAVRP